MADEYKAVFFDYKKETDDARLDHDIKQSFYDLHPDVVDGLKPEFQEDSTSKTRCWTKRPRSNPRPKSLRELQVRDLI